MFSGAGYQELASFLVKNQETHTFRTNRCDGWCWEDVPPSTVVHFALPPAQPWVYLFLSMLTGTNNLLVRHRRSMRTSTLSSATGGIAEAPGVSPKSAPRAAGKGLANGHTLAKRPERRVRRLRSLPGSSLRCTGKGDRGARENPTCYLAATCSWCAVAGFTQQRAAIDLKPGYCVLCSRAQRQS